MRECVGDAAKLLALRAAEKKLELAVEVAADVPDIVIGDAGRLRQVLLNVIGNAVKFTSEGEVVACVSLERLDHDRATLRFAVRDTGIGIPQEKQDRSSRPSRRPTTRPRGVSVARGSVWRSPRGSSS